MSFFSKFGKQSFRIDGQDFEIEDLTKKVSNFPANWYNLTYIEDFYIPQGVRPDQLANQLYRDSNLWWTFFIMNGLNQFDWPLDDEVIEEEVLTRYVQYELNKPIYRDAYETKFQSNGETIVHQNGEKLFNGELNLPRFAMIDLKTFRETVIEENELKRNIRIVSPQFVYDFTRDFFSRIS